MSKVKFESNLVKKAIQGDNHALFEMFYAFIGPEEQILEARYLGSYGFLLSKTRSLVCLTDKRVAVIQLGILGRVTYQDAFIEEVNSGIIYQPSLFGLYLVSILLACTLIGIILIPAWVQVFYLLNKSGMVWSIREGINVYAFANQSKINEVNTFWRHLANVRTQRVQFLKR